MVDYTPEMNLDPRNNILCKITRRVVALPGLLLFLLLLSNFISAQPVCKGQIMVGLADGTDPFALQERLQADARFNGWIVGDKVSDMLNVWLWKHPDTSVGVSPLLNWLRHQPEVRAAQEDHLIHLRAAPPVSWPDDPLIGNQWQYENSGQNGGFPGVDLSASEAWAITTGGTTAAGDTIVVAVIDGGVDPDHPDLIENLWINSAEIPGDGLDNDNNSYVDDYYGWNVYAGNDDISGLFAWHGTPVAGIIGAKGNNGIGVSGVNWSVKTMFVAGKGQESVLLAAFDYVWKARRRYNQSGGAEGAFVVALNCSWGVDYGQPSEAPLWCAAFEALGAEGILSIGATANEPVDVDIVGDLPTTCPSNYLIAVTSLNNQNLKAPDAAWGATHIDIGAFGEEVFTLANGGNYAYRSGTSFAAPHVAGAIALLYASPCPNLISLAASNPAAAALWVRELVLENTADAPALAGITQSGGRLDLFHLLDGYEQQCTDCPAPFGISATAVGTGNIILNWTSIPETVGVSVRWRAVGSTNWNLNPGLIAPFECANLTACTAYEFTLRANCGMLGFSTWSPVLTVQTDGCCDPPQSVSVEQISTHGAVATWPAVTAAEEYVCRVRTIGGAWQTISCTVPSIALEGLSSCTDYEIQVSTQCYTGSTDWSPPVYFMTSGCGACLDLSYCDAGANQSFEEWIAKVCVGTWSHLSAGGSGYQDFSGTGNAPHLVPGEVYPVCIEPGFSGWTYKQYFRIYLDFNGDGDFDDNGELAFDPGYATDGPVSGYLEVPATAINGLTRMRIMMEYKGIFNGPPEPCESYEHGQVKDYCVLISSGSVSSTVAFRDEASVLLYPQPARDMVFLDLPPREGQFNITLNDLSGRCLLNWVAVKQEKEPVLLDIGILSPGMYTILLTHGEEQWRVKLVVQR